MNRRRIISSLMTIIMVVSSVASVYAETGAEFQVSGSTVEAVSGKTSSAEDLKQLPDASTSIDGDVESESEGSDAVVQSEIESASGKGEQTESEAVGDCVESAGDVQEAEVLEAAEANDPDANNPDAEYEELDAIPKSRLSVIQDTDGVLLHWSAAYSEAGIAAKGYVILVRRGNNAWKPVMASASKPYSTTFFYYRDGAHVNGVSSYAIIPYYTTDYFNQIARGEYEVGDSVENNAVDYYWIRQAESISVSKSGRKLNASWSMPANSNVDGFVFQYAKTTLFNAASTVKVGSKQQSVGVNLPDSGTRYCRVKAYKVYKGKTYYSQWKTSMGKNYAVTLSKSAYTFNGCTRNLYLAAGQSNRVTGYSVMQGGTADGTYMYYIMENQQKNRVKIAKVKISTGKVVKVSSAINLDHANSMCYNSTNKTLVVVHNQTHMRRLSIIDANTLKVKKSVDVNFPSKIFATGCHKSTAGERISTTNGMIAISYIKDRNQYAAHTKGNYSEIVMLDEYFRPLYMITLSVKKADNYYYQDMAITSDYIIITQSANKNKKYTNVSCDNFAAVYDYNGVYQGKITLNKKYEVENLSIAGGRIYTAFHTSAMAKQYRWKYYKKVAKTSANRKKYSVPDKYKVKVSGRKYKVYKAKKVGGTVRCRFGKVYKS